MQQGQAMCYSAGQIRVLQRGRLFSSEENLIYIHVVLVRFWDIITLLEPAGGSVNHLSLVPVP